MKLSAKHVAKHASASLLVSSALGLVAGCQGRAHQPVVVESSTSSASGGSASTPGKSGGLTTGGVPSSIQQAGATSAGGSKVPAASRAVAAQMRGTWNGADDDVSLTTSWRIQSVTTVPAVAAAPATTVFAPTTAPAAAATAPSNPAPSAAAASTPNAATDYDSRVAQILNTNCTNCHSPGGSQSNSPMDTYDAARGQGTAIVSRSANGSMPPGGGLSSSDIQTLQDWQAGGFQKTAGAVATPANAGPTLSLTEDAQGNCFNPQKVTARVGQTLTIQNGCRSGYIPHTSGVPFPHGQSEIPPGGSQQFQLSAPSNGGTYRHTDGADNSQTQPLNLEVN